MRFDSSTLPDVSGLVVGILGGTGDQGRGLAIRLAHAGQRVLIGSRVAERAAAAAAEISRAGRRRASRAASNADVSARSDVVIVAVPYAGHADTLRELVEPLRGKMVIDCVNPLGFDKQGPFALAVEEGSAAEQAAAILPESRVTAAFHHVSAELLANLEVAEMDLDVLVLGEDREAVAHGSGARGAHQRHPRRVRRAPAQRRPGRGAHRQPDRHQQALRRTRRNPNHRSVSRIRRCARGWGRRRRGRRAANAWAASVSVLASWAYCLTKRGAGPPPARRPAMSCQTSTWASVSGPAPMPMVGTGISVGDLLGHLARHHLQHDGEGARLAHSWACSTRSLAGVAAALHPVPADLVLRLRGEPEVGHDGNPRAGDRLDQRGPGALKLDGVALRLLHEAHRGADGLGRALLVGAEGQVADDEGCAWWR